VKPPPEPKPVHGPDDRPCSCRSRRWAWHTGQPCPNPKGTPGGLCQRCVYGCDHEEDE